MRTSRWPISHLPISDITPFTYRDGETYLELLNRLSKYITEQLHPNLRKTVEHMVEEMEHILAAQHNKYVEGIQDFQRIHDAFMTDVNSALMALNDNAVSDLAVDPGTVFGQTLRELFAPQRITTKIDHSFTTPQEYGAVGDDQTDDTVAFQDMLDDPDAVNMFIPAGHYRISQPLDVGRSEIQFSGAGKDVTVLRYEGVDFAFGHRGAFISRNTFRDFTVDTRPSNAPVTGVLVDNIGRTVWDNIRVRSTGSGQTGIHFVGGDDGEPRSTYYNEWSNVELNFGDHVGIRFTGYANANTFYGGLIEGGGACVVAEQGARSNAIDTNRFSNMSMQTNPNIPDEQHIVSLGTKTGTTDVHNFSFVQCRFEAFSPVRLYLGEASSYISFVSCTRSTNITFDDHGARNSWFSANDAYIASSLTRPHIIEVDEQVAIPTDGSNATVPIDLSGIPYWFRYNVDIQLRCTTDYAAGNTGYSRVTYFVSQSTHTDMAQMVMHETDRQSSHSTMLLMKLHSVNAIVPQVTVQSAGPNRQGLTANVRGYITVTGA